MFRRLSSFSKCEYNGPGVAVEKSFFVGSKILLPPTKKHLAVAGGNWWDQLNRLLAL